MQRRKERERDQEPEAILKLAALTIGTLKGSLVNNSFKALSQVLWL